MCLNLSPWMASYKPQAGRRKIPVAALHMAAGQAHILTLLVERPGSARVFGKEICERPVCPQFLECSGIPKNYQNSGSVPLLGFLGKLEADVRPRAETHQSEQGRIEVWHGQVAINAASEDQAEDERPYDHLETVKGDSFAVAQNIFQEPFGDCRGRRHESIRQLGLHFEQAVFLLLQFLVQRRARLGS